MGGIALHIHVCTRITLILYKVHMHLLQVEIKLESFQKTNSLVYLLVFCTIRADIQGSARSIVSAFRYPSFGSKLVLTRS